MKSQNRSRLRQPGRTRELLGEIKGKHLTFEVGTLRFDDHQCMEVAIDENAAGGLSPNISFKRPGSETAERYDLNDITLIRRLRSRKWLIKIRGDANPA